MANPYGAITDVPGVLVGQTERIGDGWLTGVTAIIPPPGTIGAVDVRGGGPGTRETDALGPTTLVETVDAVTLTGGSAFGLDSATGVQRWCEEQKRGFPVLPGVFVPIVPAAVVFDLGKGGDPTARPTASMGYDAAAIATDGEVRTGVVGAGTGTSMTMAGLKGGVGTASITLPGGVIVAALAVVNAYGTPYVPGSAALLASAFVSDVRLKPLVPSPDVDPLGDALDPVPGGNTTLAVVVTNARLTHAQTMRMAAAGQDGLARAIRPAHTLVDGDSVFGLSTQDISPEVAALGDWRGSELIGGVAAVQAAAADAVTIAMLDGILSATGVATPAVTLPSYLERFPSARPPGY